MTEEYDKYESQKIRLRNKAIQIIQTLNKDEIDMNEVYKNSFSGIPDCIAGLRPVVWHLILGSLPTTTSDWQTLLE